MRKLGQSILDFLNSLPMEILTTVPRAPVNNKEAQALYSIWKNDKDKYGRSLVPFDTDPLQVAALTSKGMLKSHPINLNGKKAVDITDKGKAIIRNIILHSEQSTFEKEAVQINYEAIHQAMLDGPKKQKTAKTASWLKKLAIEYTDIGHEERDIKETQILWMHDGNRLNDFEESEPESNHYDLWGGTEFIAWGRINTASKQGSFSFKTQHDESIYTLPRILKKIIGEVVSAYPGVHFTVFSPGEGPTSLQNFWEKNFGH